MAAHLMFWAPGASADPAGTPYKRQQISDARFGSGNLQQLIKNAYTLRDTVNRSVIGQDRAARALQDRLIQYLENYGTRDKDPVSIHLIGLPGVGKSSILDSLEKLGINVIRIDAQRFVGLNASNEMSSLSYRLNEASEANVPTIVLFDEIDKLPEIVKSASATGEKTNPLIGLLNQILTDGKVSLSDNNINMSNMMVMSAMNFAPEEIETFSKNALGHPKNFYDFTVEDFAKFDQWVRSSPTARAQVLSHLFRSNTVSRLAPNAVIVKPLNADDYHKIARLTAEATVRKVTGGVGEGKRTSVSFSDRYIDFLSKNTVFPASGARDTIIKSNALTEQLISFGTKASPPGDHSLDRPRDIFLDVDQGSGEVKVTVTPKVRYRGKVSDGTAFTFPVEFDHDDRSFYRPEIVSATPPPRVPSKSQANERPVIAEKIFETRFPKAAKEARGIAARIDQSVIGQEAYTRHMENEIGSFLSRPGSVTKNPPFTVLAGFPGIGKSEIVAQSANAAGLPVVRVNLQNYSSDEASVGDKLVSDIQAQIQEAKTKRPDGKFILQLEELDKIFEVDPKDGAIKNRPAMTIIKDLLNDGRVKGVASLGYNTIHYDIDIRGAYTAITMNFAVDRFGFKADPRLTSIEDVRNAWKRLSTRPADLKEVLGSMFLPETVNRIMPKVKIVRPLEKDHYEKIIENQIETAVRERAVDVTSGKNIGAISVKLSPAYRKYLYNETVIPSEGARYTAVSSRDRIAADLDAALKGIPRSSRLAKSPVEVTLDFDPETSRVSAMARSTHPNGAAIPEKRIYDQPVVLSFPPLDIKGEIPEERIFTAVHEFGHAFAGIRHGQRFEYATVVPPENGTGGYVKFKRQPQGAKNLISFIYSTLGSRAMERVFLSDQPRSAQSIVETYSGASNDIKQATQALWSLVYEYGMDPHGGVIERMGMDGPARYAAFADLPAEKVEQLSLILRDMENHLVEDFLKAHPRDWYRDKITDFARAGGMDEKEFYHLIEYPFPGENATPVGTRTRLQKHFDGVIRKPEKEVDVAAGFQQGKTGTTAQENLDRSTDVLVKSLKRRLHSSSDAKARCLSGLTRALSE